MSFSNIEIAISERERRLLVIKHLNDSLSDASKSVLADGLPPYTVDDATFVSAVDVAIIDSLINETLIDNLLQYIAESEQKENEKRQLELDL